MDFGTNVLQELYDRFDSMCDDEYDDLLNSYCDYNLIGESNESI